MKFYVQNDFAHETRRLLHRRRRRSIYTDPNAAMITALKTYLRQWFLKRKIRRITPANARERVARGAAYLDEVDPGWYQRIDLDVLELGSGSACVLGQLHGDFRLGLSRSQLIDLSSAPRANLSPASYGFRCVDDVDDALQAEDYAYLNRAWREEIHRRKHPDAAAPSSGPLASHADRPVDEKEATSV